MEAARKRSEWSSMQVLDTPQNAKWREYYHKAQANRLYSSEQVKEFLAKRKRNRMDVYSPRELGEYFHVSPATAYQWMRNDLVPAFQVGRFWYVHESVVEFIRKRIDKLLEDDLLPLHYGRRQWPRIVKRIDMGLPWK